MADVPSKTSWSDLGGSVRLGLLGLVIAVAACLGVSLWGERSDDELTTSVAAMDHGAFDTASVGRAIEAGRSFLDLQEEWERRLQAKVDRVLARAFGSTAAATLHVELERHTGTRSGVRDLAAGLSPNVVESTPIATDSASRLRPEPIAGVHRRETNPDLYGQRFELQLAPQVRRITAAIVLDAGEFEAAESRERASEAATELVRQAIGFDEARGDELPPPVFVTLASIDAPPNGLAFLVPGMWILLGLAVLAAARWCFRWRDRETGTAHRMRESLESAIERDPEEVARLLGTWAQETRS